jgi:hypothetical protein
MASMLMAWPRMRGPAFARSPGPGLHKVVWLVVQVVAYLGKVVGDLLADVVNQHGLKLGLVEQDVVGQAISDGQATQGVVLQAMQISTGLVLVALPSGIVLPSGGIPLQPAQRPRSLPVVKC